VTVLKNVELGIFNFKLRAEFLGWLGLDKLDIPVYDILMIEGKTPVFQEILGIKDVFLKEHYQDGFLYLCSLMFEIIRRNSGSALCYLDSREGKLPKLHQFLGNLKRPPIEGFLSCWNELGDWTVELVTPSFLNFDDGILLEFKKYAANQLLGYVENEEGREKYTYAKLKIEYFKVNL